MSIVSHSPVMILNRTKPWVNALKVVDRDRSIGLRSGNRVDKYWGDGAREFDRFKYSVQGNLERKHDVGW